MSNSVSDWVFCEGKDARKGHNRKLAEGIKILPSICRRLSKKVELTSNTFGEVQTFNIEKNGVVIGSITFPPYTSGSFEDPTIPKRTIDFDLNAACFYVDWDNTNGDWKFAIPADKDQLKDNIRSFREVMTSQ